MFIEELALDFFNHCGYRIHCTFEDDVVLPEKATRFYSELFETPANTHTVSASREQFRTVLKANGVQATPVTLAVMDTKQGLVRHNMKVSTLRKEYRQAGFVARLDIARQLNELQEQFNHYLLEDDLVCHGYVKQELTALLARL